MLVSFAFEAVAGLAPLTSILPQNTSIYHQWPQGNLKVPLPKFLSVATAVPDASIGSNFTVPNYDEHTFLSPPIHVRDGDFLSVSVKNSLQATGLSIHWHGFEMTNHLEFDGVVGITQCPISPGESFTYAWEISETPGTYWYHTHSGELGIDAHNAIMGPLIVHPKIEDETSVFSEVPFLDSTMYESDPYAQQHMSLEDLLFYGNERILFFKDGFLHSGEVKNVEMAGGLNPPISYNGDYFSVGTYPWQFGTCNGKLREVVPVLKGQTFKFRILNAGSMYALRISFDGLKMTIIAADSEPVEPVEVDEIIVHAAERFDVEVTIPNDAPIGSTSWIRADTLERRDQGYQNGIRAILHVVDPNNTNPVDANKVPDPDASIETNIDHKTRLTHNCYSFTESNEISGEGGCLPVSALHLQEGTVSYASKAAAEAAVVPFEAHIIDWQFSASPQFAHFVRIDGGKWLQHAMNHAQSMLVPEYNSSTMLHSNGAVLNVEAGVRALLIWRNKSSMDHPIHLHGRKMEILDELIVEKREHCDHVKCSLSDIFSSDDELQRLADIPVGSKPLKDTFILPAGGVVATRIFTDVPALWFAHCHLESHREDGMAMILNVGNYQSPSDSSWLPSDYPKCDTPYLSTKKEFPSCECYINEDALMDNALTKDHRCSRDYLCFHHDSPQSSLESYPYESNGISIRSEYSVHGWVISLLIVSVIVVLSNIIAYRRNLIKALGPRKSAKFLSNDGSSRGVDPVHTAVNVEQAVLEPVQSGIAVLLINVQNEFVDTKGKLNAMVKVGMKNNSSLEKTIELVKLARNNGALVIHAVTVIKEGSLDNEYKAYYSSEEIFRPGSWNAEIPSGLYNETDAVFKIQTANALTPELLDYLENNSITQVFLCGYTMDMHINETLMTACEELGEETDLFVVQDCCVARSVQTMKSQKRLVAKQSSSFVATNLNQSEAKVMITNKSNVLAKSPEVDPADSKVNNKRGSVSVLVKRDLPLTLDLPGTENPRRSTLIRGRSTIKGRNSRDLSTHGAENPRRSTLRSTVMGRSSRTLPIAEKSFTVPKRRTQLNIEVEGFKVEGNVTVEADENGINEQTPFMQQFFFLFHSQWLVYRPTCVSLLRMTEVTSLAFFTGALFYSIGSDPTATGFGSVNSLLFFSVTLWTFTRMYPAINTHWSWNESVRMIANEHRYDLVPVCLARSCVVFLCESGWPFIYVFVCYPLASMAGSWSVMMRIGLMLALNNLCYISIGSVLGVVVDKIPKGMIISTIVAQSSLVAAGFYTEVPQFLAWLRFLSPVFWTYRGIVKSAFVWSDTFQCRWGSTLAGVNSCFIEFHTSINNLKDRGINVATFGDDHSTQIWFECIVLVILYIAMQTFILGLSLFRQIREDKWEIFFERLAEYRAVHGDTDVPSDYKIDDGRLGLWVKLQRMKLKTGKLTDEQVERLDELGFERS